MSSLGLKPKVKADSTGKLEWELEYAEEKPSGQTIPSTVPPSASTVPPQSMQQPAPIAPDDYLARLVKLTPVESVAIFLIAMKVITSTPSAITLWLQWAVFLVLLIATPLLFMRLGAPRNQTIILTIGFVAWAFAIGGPFTNFSWYQPVYGAAALAAFAMLSPLFV